jgi:hypothetical protein
VTAAHQITFQSQEVDHFRCRRQERDDPHGARYCVCCEASIGIAAFIWIRSSVDRRRVLRQRTRTQQVPPVWGFKGTRVESPGCPRNCKRCARIEDHWIDEIREGDGGTPSREPGNLLVVVAHRAAGVC